MKFDVLYNTEPFSLAISVNGTSLKLEWKVFRFLKDDKRTLILREELNLTPSLVLFLAAICRMGFPAAIFWLPPYLGLPFPRTHPPSLCLHSFSNPTVEMLQKQKGKL